MKRALQILAAALTALLPATARAGTPEDSGYFISAWRTDDGLPPLVSPLLIEAPEGFLWMEAEAGPVRFDGDRFTVFPAASPGWPQGTRIARAFADGTQGLWITLRDRSLWRERGGHWTPFPALPDNEIITMFGPRR